MSGESTVPAAAMDQTLEASSHAGGIAPAVHALQVRLPQRYRRMGEIARGGMGRILVAYDLELNRMIAIKELLAPSAPLERRFEREIQITARLQHPGIIAVQEAGRWPDGAAFYTMPLVRGRSLDGEIARATTLPARLAHVPRVLAIADAIAYAHGEHIVHRDLKPSNILVGTFGETIVIDWGLAKDVRDDLDVAASSLDGEYPADVTVLGSAIGTPAYMPPEQARGERVDARADVYALGAILYHVLAGRRPYADVRVASEVVAHVLDGPPASIDALAPDAPADLRAIVTKAMARDPDDRYATAAGFADDLRRFTTGQLVAAHRYSAAQRLGRWIRRHRAVVAVGSLAIVALAVVAVIAVVGIRRERDEANARRAEVEGLLDFMLLDLHDKLKPVGKLELLELVANKADDYYTERPRDGDARRRGIIQVHIGDIRHERGDIAGALEAYQRALELLGGAGAERDLAHAYELIGDMRRAQGDLPGALAANREALAIRERLVARGPDRVAEHDLASSHDRIGRMLLGQGDVDGALDHRQRALAIVERHAAATPDDPATLRSLLVMHLALAEVYEVRAELPAALGAIDRALAIAEQRLAAAPEDVDALRGVSAVLDRRGTIQQAAGDLPAALETQRRSLAAAEQLAARDPDNAMWASDVATSHVGVAAVQKALGDPAGALVSYRAAHAIRVRLAALDPSDAEAARALASSFDAIATREIDLGDLASAQRGLDEAFAIRSTLAAAAPDSNEAQRDLYISHYKYGALHQARGDHAASRQSLETALALAKAAVARFPDVPQLASDVTRIEAALGELR